MGGTLEGLQEQYPSLTEAVLLKTALLSLGVRYDQLMHFCWKFLFPLSLIYMAITAVVVALV